jgi:alpha-amylase/alpha-mannosidase (GH57 family)
MTLKVAILWHMHQPDYRDPVSGRTLLPWTYLHAVKDYGEMLKTAGEGEGRRMTFNLVPTLLEQLERYSRGEANDLWLDMARKDPAWMSSEERYFLLRHFFSVHSERHILPHRRYRELARRRGTAPDPDVHPFSEGDLRDLQVWFLLGWAGHHLRRDPHVRYLLNKGEAFTEGEKHALLDLYDREVGAVTELYRTMEEQGRIEISVTPYAHPILPLLCGTEIASQATPGIHLPAVSFRHPEDARLQIRLGLDLVEEKLGARPRGMWPSEGSVSQEAVRLIKEEGALWAASDEAILAKSLTGGLGDRKDLYRPYAFEGLPLFFRDRDLSDRIGFVYAHWEPKRAAADLIGELRNIARISPGGTVSLILDGENCWERYEDNGYPFLSALYQGLAEEKALRMVTFSEALAQSEPLPLSRLAPGSWINANFNIWIGHHEENTAWEWLERSRRDVFGRTGVIPMKRGEAVPESVKHLLRAEGSDWFWWFGDDHVTDQADFFDRLFRRHLEALYREAGLPVPPHLHRFIKIPTKVEAVREPTALFTPEIDGKVGDYFEWLAAGSAALSTAGAMHAARSEFSTLLYGYDTQRLYLRLDPEEDLPTLLGADGALEVRLETDERWIVRLCPAALPILTIRKEGEEECAAEGKGACGRIVEMAIPLGPLGLHPGKHIGLSVHLVRGGSEQARWPSESALALPYRGKRLEEEEWYV